MRNQRNHDRVKGMRQRSSRSTTTRKPKPTAAKQNSGPITLPLDLELAAAEPKNRIWGFIATECAWCTITLEKILRNHTFAPMQLRWKELFTSKVDAEVHWDRWDLVALWLAVFAVIWVFLFKLWTFYALGYTSDLFVHVQLARSWLEGRGLLHDNCFGNQLAIHTYFFLIPLGILAKPFGAPGLLFVLAASVGAAYFWATRILRLLGVDGRLALIAAGVVLISPF